jgi:CDP-diacylglycerol--serine O-phosphatidyltransferase
VRSHAVGALQRETNPVLKNPGRPGRKYFAGLPIPSAAAMVAAVVFAANSTPLRDWRFSVAWLALLALLSFLMVSTWRYPSFKDLNLLRPRSPFVFVLAGTGIYLVWTVPQPVLLALAICYVGSGIILRIGGIMRRRTRQTPHPEHQVG